MALPFDETFVALTDSKAGRREAAHLCGRRGEVKGFRGFAER